MMAGRCWFNLFVVLLGAGLCLAGLPFVLLGEPAPPQLWLALAAYPALVVLLRGLFGEWVWEPVWDAVEALSMPLAATAAAALLAALGLSVGLDWDGPVLKLICVFAMIGGSLGYVLACGSLDALRDDGVGFVGLIGGAAYGLGVMIALDVALDLHPPRQVDYQLVSKERHRSRRSTYFSAVLANTETGRRERMSISMRQYNDLDRAGAPVRVLIHPGLLGAGWGEVLIEGEAPLLSRTAAIGWMRG